MAAPPLGNSCCQLSGAAPSNKPAAITPRALVVDNIVAAGGTTSHTDLSPARHVSAIGAMPPLPTSSHLALLCILLV
jgi:hypothetical protein